MVEHRALLLATLLLQHTPAQAELAQLFHENNMPGFEQILEPKAFQFPTDHGPHPEFRQEWWYLTTTLTGETQRFGMQFTLFRLALQSPVQAGLLRRTSPWAAQHLYMGHLTLSDVKNNQFHHSQRLARGAMGLAGATRNPVKIWLDHWSLELAETTPLTGHIRATGDDFAVDLAFTANKPVVLQGEKGLSRKGEKPGSASHYYSLPRLTTRGNITVNASRQEVTGLGWLDREWSSQGLEPGLQGWDWFALHLNDGWEVMLYQLRRDNGTPSPVSAATLIDPQGQRHPLTDWTLHPTSHWTSPDTGIQYPMGWQIQTSHPPLALTLHPWMAQQELFKTSVRYWEGAVSASGHHQGQQVAGEGYVEMTGYPVKHPPL